MATANKTIRRVKSRDLSDVPDQNKGNDGVKLQDKYEMYSIPDNSNGEFLPIRTIGGVVATKTHWLMIETKEGKQISIPQACLNFDPEEQAIDESRGCPFCKAENWFKSNEVTAKDSKGRENNPARSSLEYITNAIIRELQEDIQPRITLESEKETGIIQKGSKSKTPVRVVRLTGGVVTKFKDVEKLNVHKVKVKGQVERRSMPVSHPKYGRDVLVKFNPKAKSASDFYAVQGGDKSPLEDEELKYLKWDIEAWPFENEAKSQKDAEAEVARFKGKHWDKYRKYAGLNDESDDYEDEDDFEDDYDDEDEDDRPKSKKSSKKTPAKKKSRRDEEEDDEDDEEDERPKKSSKKAPAKKSRRDEEEDDEDEDDDFDDDEDEDEDDEDDFDDEDEDDEDDFDDEDDEDEDDEDEDDEDEDEDDFDDDEDEDEEPAKKSSKKSPKKPSKKSRDEDEDDDLDDEDDDEDEDERPKKSSKKAPAKKSRRDEDEDDLDDDEDEDEDERPKSKKSSKKAPAKKPTKKKSRRDEDEDDDDLPF